VKKKVVKKTISKKTSTTKTTQATSDTKSVVFGNAQGGTFVIDEEPKVKSYVIE